MPLCASVVSPVLIDSHRSPLMTEASPSSTYEHRCRVASIELETEPMDLRATPVVVPVEAANAQAIIPVSVGRAPEEHILALPLLRDEVRMDEQVI